MKMKWQVRVIFDTLSASLLYDLLMDSEYRELWDSVMKETFTVYKLDAQNTITYYASMTYSFNVSSNVNE